MNMRRQRELKQREEIVQAVERMQKQINTLQIRAIENAKQIEQMKQPTEPVSRGSINRKALQISKVIKSEVTGYCACVKCCGKNDGITYSGLPVKAGLTIAMDLSKYPLGTKVMIEGFEDTIFEVQDKGSAITGNDIDVYFNTHEEALQFGRQVLNVKILK